MGRFGQILNGASLAIYARHRVPSVQEEAECPRFVLTACRTCSYRRNAEQTYALLIRRTEHGHGFGGRKLTEHSTENNDPANSVAHCVALNSVAHCVALKYSESMYRPYLASTAVWSSIRFAAPEMQGDRYRLAWD